MLWDANFRSWHGYALTRSPQLWPRGQTICNSAIGRGGAAQALTLSNYWQLVAAGKKAIFFSLLACFWMCVLGFSGPSGGPPPAYSRGWPHMLSHVAGPTCILAWMAPHVYSCQWEVLIWLHGLLKSFKKEDDVELEGNHVYKRCSHLIVYIYTFLKN